MVREAIAYEDATSTSEAHHDVGGTVVSRTAQSTAGLLIGTAVAGIALGGLFGLVYAFALGRVGPRSPRPLAVALMAYLYWSMLQNEEDRRIRILVVLIGYLCV